MRKSHSTLARTLAAATTAQRASALTSIRTGRKQLEIDMTDSSPEEKLNRIIVKKKRMLKDFFLTCGGEFDDDMTKEFAAINRFCDLHDGFSRRLSDVRY